ncbi:MAG: Gfo/Idh/MocA family protein [Agrococcus casei]|uniref:Gfo/Idh/MocA family protein n=1 Tax=Agrococcus casei TaxID=343512 RepID=UPI003F90DBC8
MTFTKAPLRAGIIGGGFMAETHARAIRAAGGLVSVAAASSPERAAAAQASTGAQHAANSADALIRREDVDVVHVCSPNASHEEYAIRALEAGKWVVCEKPLAVTGESAARIVAAADIAGLTGTVPFVYRFHPMVREMRAQIADGALGTPSVINGSYLQDWLADAEITNWRVDPAQGGRSRAFADIGSHWFDLLEFVTGDPVVRVSAQACTAFERRDGSAAGNEDAMTVQFTTQQGVIGTMSVSQVSAGRKNRLHLEVSGSDASFAFDQEQPDSIWKGTTSGFGQVVRESPMLSADAARLSFLPAGHPQGYQDAFNAFVADSYAHFGDSLPPGAEHGLPQLADGLRAAQICDAVLASVDGASAWVAIPAAFTEQPHRQQSTQQSQ